MDYKELYSPKPEEPAQPGISGSPEASAGYPGGMPGTEENDAYFRSFDPDPSAYPDLTPPPQPAAYMNRRVYAMAALAAVLIFLLCLYCIISDLLHGALPVETDVPEKSSVVIQMQKTPELDPDDENVNADGTYTVYGVSEAVKPSIVEVCTYEDEERQVLKGNGSGVVISEDGYIVTNAHVLAGTAYSIVTSDGDVYEAAVVGSDTKTDLAVLKAEGVKLIPAVFGDSDAVQVGQDVVAIGNPAGLQSTVTKGIVSAVNRQIRSEKDGIRMECIQTDAAISPGNSGGALVNMYGQVIGITSSKYASQYAAGYEGLGFAIAAGQALPIVEELMEQGFVSGRFRIGIVFLSMDSEYAAYQFGQTYDMEMPDDLQGLWVTEISEDCDIAGTQLQKNDFILSFNGTKVHNYDEVMAVLEGSQGGDTVAAECARVEENGEISYFSIEFKLETDTSGNY